MGKAIQEIQSQSGNGSYNIVLGNDYRIYCTCKAWQFSRPPIKECKHLRELFDVAVEGQSVMVALQKPKEPKRNEGMYIRRVLID
jgi:hypothetical protein